VKSTGERIKCCEEYWVLGKGLKNVKSTGERIKDCEEYWRKD